MATGGTQGCTLESAEPWRLSKVLQLAAGWEKPQQWERPVQLSVPGKWLGWVCGGVRQKGFEEVPLTWHTPGGWWMFPLIPHAGSGRTGPFHCAWLSPLAFFHAAARWLSSGVWGPSDFIFCDLFEL